MSPSPERSRRRRGRGRPRGGQGPRGRAPQGDPRTGERFTLDVGEVAHGGHCVARHEGQVVFVRHALPGERVVAVVTSGTTRSSFLRADAVEILTASPQRREAPCPYAGPGQCGGCDWQHTSAAYGRVLKARVVREQLSRLAGLDLPVVVEPVPGDEDGLRWRTRVELAVGPDGRAGMRRHRSHEVLPVDDCLIADEQVAGSGVLQERFGVGVHGVDVAHSSTGELAVVTLPETGEVPTLTEEVRVDASPLRLEVSARGFWQVHPGAARTFVQHVLDELDARPGESVLDLYCGVGLFAAALGERVGPSGSVLGIEGDRQAVEDGQRNVERLPHVQVERAEVGRWVETGPTEPLDLVVLDPPRSGAGRTVMERVLARGPRAVAYVACDPSALGRDLAYAAEAGYEVRTLRAFDAFPMTHHVECVAVLVPTAGAAAGEADLG
ncbi:class I SAM-dependent RNA methyltransferase [Luteipulveratus sp. YIM 133132]|uniref:class I SAM-dependent RNA methyltransferase n=1 Tax=Luteipulveratus flavus TaxID=3031728 RepID=UPI0023AEA275|nr:class I SAM-dependent RNA methyltransferase [Luteipulveratus sp. YIM 133132]MDE9366811.1 class I SAM-dependent RNA methyltransferase [Luteipulveratus sp. YIM 133132]